MYGKENTNDQRKRTFIKECNGVLDVLRNIGENLSEKRPVWIKATVPVAWQIDQFLHAFYYSRVVGQGLSTYEDYYQKNKKNPDAKLSQEIEWWRSLNKSPSNEDKTLYEFAPFINAHLSKDKILSLTEDDFIKICDYTHATKEHAEKISLSTLGYSEQESTSQEESINLYVKWLLKQRNQKGWSILELLNYVLYGGAENEFWMRVFNSSRVPEYLLPHYGLNSIAEVAGWACPEVTPPINSRTGKALRALGYDVKVF